MVAAPGSGGYFEWVVQLTRGQLLDLILEIEDRLRQFVRSVFKENRDDWERLIPEEIRSALVERAVRSPTPAGDLLDHADLGQLISMVLARWKQFEPVLGDKPRFQARADEFREWRNFLAHGKHPSEEEKVEIAVLARQVGRQIPAVADSAMPRAQKSISGATVLWVDDHPEWNLHERQVLRALGMDVVPVLSNDEALETLRQQRFDVVISDIARSGSEAGTALPGRLQAEGFEPPTVFYVGAVDSSRPVPAGGVAIHDDPALLVRDILNLLSNPHPASG